MLTSTSRFETTTASKYLQALCKHFAHKVPVTYDALTGEAALPPGTARLRADEGGLDIEVTAADADKLARVQHIVEDHLLRFAFRDAPGPLVWSD